MHRVLNRVAWRPSWNFPSRAMRRSRPCMASLTAVLPAIGGALSGSKDAYEYLPESIGKFPTAEKLAERMQAAGFRSVEFMRLTAGTVALHVGVK